MKADFCFESAAACLVKAEDAKSNATRACLIALAEEWRYLGQTLHAAYECNINDGH